LVKKILFIDLEIKEDAESIAMLKQDCESFNSKISKAEEILEDLNSIIEDKESGKELKKRASLDRLEEA
jgi:flagellin-specific chaperone FliS